MAVFPSREWVAAVLESVEKNKKFQETAKHWESDFLCIGKGDEQLLRDLGKKDVIEGFASFVDMIPAERRMKYKSTPTGNLLEKLGIPLDAPVQKFNAGEALEKAKNVSLNDAKGLTLYIWVDFWHGALRNLEPVAPGEHQDVVFKLTGDYSIWKQIASGKQELIPLIITNKLKVEVDRYHMPTEKRKLMMRNMNSTVALVSELLASLSTD